MPHATAPEKVHSDCDDARHAANTLTTEPIGIRVKDTKPPPMYTM